jgi:hypothetical protein
MARKIEAGPLVALLGAGLLLVSLFLEWFTPGASAWDVFEVLDLLLAAVAIAAALAALGLLAPEIAVLDRRWIAPLAFLALVVVGSQLIDPPPAVADGERGLGAWLALAGALLLVTGALLSFSRVRFAVTIEGRELRQRKAAVVARQGDRPVGSEGGSRVAAGPAGSDASAGSTGNAGSAAAPAEGEPLASVPPREA